MRIPRRKLESVRKRKEALEPILYVLFAERREMPPIQTLPQPRSRPQEIDPKGHAMPIRREKRAANGQRAFSRGAVASGRRDHRQAAGENLSITCRARVGRRDALDHADRLSRRGRAAAAAHTGGANQVINSFPPAEQGPLSLIKFFGIMALTWGLSRLSTKVGPAFD
jgi:hypothetical protein